MTLPVEADYVTAVVAALQAQDIVVDNARRPDGAGWQGTPGASAFQFFAVVYPQPEEERTGPLGRPDDDAQFRVQVTCVGDDPDAVLRFVHDVEAALLGRQLTVAGRERVRCFRDGGGGLDRDDTTAEAPQFYATPQFVLTTT